MRMGVFRRARQWLSAAFSGDTPPRPIAEVLLEMSGRGLLPRAGRNEALSVAPILRGRNLICSISTLPLVQCDPDRRIVRLPLLEQIDPDVPNVVTLAQTVEDLLFEGLSWWEIIRWDAADYPVFARHLDFSSVSINPPPGRTPAPLPSGYDPREAVIYYEGRPILARRVIRFDSPNPGLLKAAGRSIRRAVLLDQTSSLYADNPRPLDYFSPTEGADPVDDEEVKAILADWLAARKRRSTAYVPAALKYNTVDTPTPADLQLVELERQATLGIANALGLDPEDLGISTTSRTYQNGIDRRQDRINDVLSPYMKAITDRLSMPDVTKRGYYVRFTLDDYLRADPKTRAEVASTYIESRVWTVDEAREREGQPALTSAQRAELAPPPAAEPTPLPDNVRPIRAAMGADERSTPLTFEGPAPAAAFASVDLERRIIEGVALPFNRVAVKNGTRYRFQPGALQYVEMKRNKLLRDHDFSQPQGRLVMHEDRAEGVFVRYKVGSGPDGDRTLAEADEGVRDGLSVGVDIVETEPDPLYPGVELVLKAEWYETSVLAVPAFDDARVTRVVATKQGSETVGDKPTTTAEPAAPPNNAPTSAPPAPPTPAPTPALQLQGDQLKGLLAVPGVLQALAGVPAPQGQQKQETQQFGLYPEQIQSLVSIPGVLQMLTGTGAQVPPAEVRPTVDPTRAAGSAEVREEAPYRFDRKGNLMPGAQYDFSTDVIHGLRDGDREALARAEKFVHEQFVIQSDVASLNPAIQRPDLYVDQKDFTYPIWEVIEKGTLADATPFVLPKFNTSSGLVAAHVEGTEPSLGTFTATSQTITPSPVSGKVKISREAWDQGGNPQMSGLIWRQMTRAWFEALEASGVTLLEGLAPTTITITTAAADSALEQSLTSQLAPLQYVRGGFRFRDFFIQVDLYKALVAAKDSNGRRLFPNLNPQNATGTVSDFFADLMVAGLRGRPAWALAATSANSANSYLFDRNDVSGWATAPNRLTFEQIEVANVYIGIWGYKALACTDITGVRRLAYDPV